MRSEGHAESGARRFKKRRGITGLLVKSIPRTSPRYRLLLHDILINRKRHIVAQNRSRETRHNLKVGPVERRRRRESGVMD
jgi:hypothetical protein